MTNQKGSTQSKKTGQRLFPGFIPPPEDNWLARIVDFMLKFRRYGRDALSIVLILLALLTLLGLIGLTSGVWITPWANFLRRWFGWGSILVVAAAGAAGLLLIQRGKSPFSAEDWGKVIWLEVSAFAALALLSIFGGNSIERAEAGQDGGVVGWGISELIGLLLNPLPDGLATGLKVVFLFLVTVLGILFGFQLLGVAIQKLESLIESGQQVSIEQYDSSPSVVVGSSGDLDQLKPKTSRGTQKKVHIPHEFRKSFKIEEDDAAEPVSFKERDPYLPPYELLESGSNFKPSERHINQTAGLIEKTLAEFGIPAKVIGFQVGPTITQFALEPGFLEKHTDSDKTDEQRQKVRVAQILSLRKDLALALSVERLRIQAPVPGRPYVGVEVPNEKSVTVGLRSVLETDAFYKMDSPLALAIGRDVSGAPVVADLTRMPHLLIAGTTGSGKSVCIAALTTCLAMNNSPEELRLVMIDPKMVELVRFNGLPHLIGKVETDLERISAVLHWVVVEMQERYKLLEELKARDIESFNRKALRRKEFEPLPRIVVLVDELADLMMSAAEQTESTIVRLAQMARAVGIHLVIATQRPSTDVVTGLIKANFPARISFAVASGVDSRVILDSTGAENLLGRGDMLFLSPEEGTPIRAQGVHISDKELERLISFWQQNWREEELDSPWDGLMESEAVLADKDDLVEQAIEIIRATGNASTSMLQRRLKVGYPRAARLMDELEDLGVVGPSRGGGRERDVLIDRDEEPENYWDED
ncbi:MAG: DNA translocase FtsK [Anaerolineales bacterium]|nr:DNA translocase FtsK [Anaerolineales bacterium]